MKVKGNILFKEEQQFRVIWLWGLIIACMLSATGLTIGIALTDKIQMKKAWIALLIMVPFEVLLAYGMYITKLQTVVSTEGIYYKWWPFQRSYRFIAAAEIEKAVMRNSPAMSYGCNWVPGYGRAHTTGPGKGVQFVLRSGKKIFVGTNKQNAFQLAIDKMVNVPTRV
ncbi:MAG: hypothetical protein E6H09_00615 [Bacteroidetes bacterium]|jgi:hypothetical protein|nr:MAG: hypothetical protein E6H09_00615 [Bacteroidota bacterium]